VELVHTVKQFLNRQFSDDKPLLLALSGGADSMALLYLLLESSFPFAVAHVDHGWRGESREEAEKLQKLCQELKIFFHLKTLDPSEISGNLEAACRSERQIFFKELCQINGYQAVLLAHHRDDQSETVLKNILEGAGLNVCGGMKQIALIDDVEYWRPLLSIPKQQLLHWLKHKNVSYFFDSTNEDQRFLRARMRSQILPELSRIFGKEVGQNLATAGRGAQELDKFMQSHMNRWVCSIEHGPMGDFLDLRHHCPETLFEVKYLIGKMLASPRRTIVQQAANHLLAGSSNKKFNVGSQTLVVDRKILFVYKEQPDYLFKKHHVLRDPFDFGPWSVTVEELLALPSGSCWRQAFNGEFSVVLPKSSTPNFLGSPDSSSAFLHSTSLRKWWSNHKVPAFLRHLFPVIWNDGRIIHEFLTGKVQSLGSDEVICERVTLKFR